MLGMLIMNRNCVVSRLGNNTCVQLRLSIVEAEAFSLCRNESELSARAVIAFDMGVTVLIRHIMGTSTILYESAKMGEARLQGSVT